MDQLELMCHAAKRGDVATLKLHLTAEPDISQLKDRTGMTLLHFAAMGDRVEVCEFLRLRGANAHAQCNTGDQPIHLAAARGNPNVCKWLLGEGVDLNRENLSGHSPPQLARMHGHEQLATLLEGLATNGERARTLTRRTAVSKRSFHRQDAQQAGVAEGLPSGPGEVVLKRKGGHRRSRNRSRAQTIEVGPSEAAQPAVGIGRHSKSFAGTLPGAPAPDPDAPAAHPTEKRLRRQARSLPMVTQRASLLIELDPQTVFLKGLAVAMSEALGRDAFLLCSQFLVVSLHNITANPTDDRLRSMRTADPKLFNCLRRPAALTFLQEIKFTAKGLRGFEVLEEDIPKLQCAEKVLVQERKALNVLDAWQLFFEDLTIEERIGSGCFGNVFGGTWCGQDVAIKTLKAQASQIGLQSFVSEANIMKNLKHNNVIELLGVVLDREHRCMVFELMAASLQDELRTQQYSQLERLSMAMEVAAGLEYLHHRNILHCDLATRNVLVSPQRQLKICDFGMARLAGSPQADISQKEIPLAIRWAAPELLADRKLTKATDTWSLGVVFYEISTAGATPYIGMSNEQVYESISSGFRLLRPKDCDTAFHATMLSCWEAKAKKRPEISSIVKALLGVKLTLSTESHRKRHDADASPPAAERPPSPTKTGRGSGRRKLGSLNFLRHRKKRRNSPGPFSYYFENLSTAASSLSGDPEEPSSRQPFQIDMSLELEEQPWFHGTVSWKRVHEKVEPVLKASGDWVVCGIHGEGAYVLSVLWQVPQDIILLPGDDGMYSVNPDSNDRKFRSVLHLLEFHCVEEHPLVYAGETLSLRRGIHLRASKLGSAQNSVISNASASLAAPTKFDYVILYQMETEGAFARNLYTALEEADPGKKCFLDQYDLTNGDWEEGYAKAISQSRNVIVILSEKLLDLACKMPFSLTALKHCEVAFELQQIGRLSVIPVFLGQYLDIEHPRKAGKTFHVYEEFDQFDVSTLRPDGAEEADVESAREAVQELIDLKLEGIFVDPEGDLVEACAGLLASSRC